METGTRLSKIHIYRGPIYMDWLTYDVDRTPIPNLLRYLGNTIW